MKRLKFLYLWSLAVGAMDACTGLLLIASPGFALRMMGIPAPQPGTAVFLSWMGAFIAAVGLSYGLVFRGPRDATTVWIFTAGVRLMVASFLAWKIMAGELPVSWSMVLLTDFVVATVQCAILRARWWEGVPR